MTTRTKYKELAKRIPSYGFLTYAFFALIILSGLLLALVYDPQNPAVTTSRMFFGMPAALLARSLHYWSSQLFLVFTCIHIIDHLIKKREEKLSGGKWLRRVMMIPFVFYAMLSGFILKADPDGIHALSIFRSMISALPLLGQELEYTFVGPAENMNIMYVHHICTATLVIWLVTIEHSKKILPPAKYTLFVLPPAVFLTVFMVPGVHNGLMQLAKGPWFFLGIQEMMSWTSSPEWINYMLIFLLAILFMVKYLESKWRRAIRQFLIYTPILFILLIIFGAFFRGNQWNFSLPWQIENINTIGYYTIFDFINTDLTDGELASVPLMDGRPESCLICHSQVSGFSPSHDPQALGCSRCHLGDPLTPNMDCSHRRVILIPGNLSVADKTCGRADCHPRIIPRVRNSIMNTASGMISVDKYVFGELAEPTGLFRAEDIGNTAAETHLKQMCIICHTGMEKTMPAAVSEASRGGGCNACHLNYSNEAKIYLKRFLMGEKDFLSRGEQFVHPSLSLDISNDHCFGCHSRSGRISTCYEGWHETQKTRQEADGKANYRILEDERVFRRMPADVHHQSGLLCIDCHNSYEVMGDGNSYEHKEQQLQVECVDCHVLSDAKVISYRNADYESRKIIDLRNIDRNRKFIRIGGDKALVNTFIENNRILVKPKAKDTLLYARVPPDICGQKIPGHKRLSCKSCHNDWSPQCIGCHTQYEQQEPGFDHLAGVEKQGGWVEYIGDYHALPPALGVFEGEVETFVPGMILTVDKNGFNEKFDNYFRRLYAPAFSHTIRREARSCKSCHNSPLAIGYGSGDLIFDKKSKRWEYFPRYSVRKEDKLPEDAWTGFLKKIDYNAATRPGARPFDISEQKNILRAGACFECHDDTDDDVIRHFYDNPKYYDNISEECLIPAYHK